MVFAHQIAVTKMTPKTRQELQFDVCRYLWRPERFLDYLGMNYYSLKSHFIHDIQLLVTMELEKQQQ